MKHAADHVLGGIASPHLASLASAVGAGWVHGEAPASALAPFAGDAAEALVTQSTEADDRSAIVFGATPELVQAGAV